MPRFMTVFRPVGILAALLLACSPSLAAPSQTAARVGQLTATEQEIEDALYIFRKRDPQFNPRSPVQRQGAAEAVLRPRQLAQSALVQREPPEAQRYIEQQKLAGWLQGWLEVQEAHALARLNDNPELLEKRAKEIYEQRLDRYRHPKLATVSVLVIDTFDKTFEQVIQRVEEVRKRLAVEPAEAFERLASEWTEDPGAKGDPARVTFQLEPAQLFPKLQKVIFEQLKPGEIGGPYVSNFGLVFLKLQSIKEAGVRSFADLKDAIIAEIRTDVAKKARLDAYSLLSQEPVELLEATAPKTDNKPN